MHLTGFIHLISLYKEAATASHRSILSILAEAAKLRVSPKRLGLTEYIDFQLYKEDLPWSAKLAFGGQRAQNAADDLLIDECSRFLSLDKITMYALLSGFNLPIPSIRAIYRSVRPSYYTQLHSKEELSRFISMPGNLPIYLKRSHGSYGRGNALITDYDGQSVTLGNGTSESFDHFANSLDDGHSLGWMLQDPLLPHPSIEALTGSRKISGIRIHTFMGKTQPKALKAIFKINAGLRDSDNFEHGASGNMLAAVDIKSGRITRAINGVGLRQTELLTSPSNHAELIGFEVPYWSDVVNLVLDAQKAFPGFICPGWDIALCADGPKILEVNSSGDIDLPQHAYRVGFFDDAFMACLQERGLAELIDQSSGKNKRSTTSGRLGVKKHHWSWW